MQKRELVTCILLTIVTCGIYGIIWFVGLTDDVGRASGDKEFRGGTCLLLIIVTCGIYGFVYAYKLGKNIGVIKQKVYDSGYTEDDSVLYLLLHLFGLSIVYNCLAQMELNKYIDKFGA